MSIPFDRPVASMMLFSACWPMSDSGLPSAPPLCKCRVRLGSCRGVVGCSRDRSSNGGIAAIVTVWVGVVVAADRETTAIALHPPHSVIPGKKGSCHPHPPMSRPCCAVGRDRRRIAQSASYNRRLPVKCASNFTKNCKLNAIDPLKILELWRVCPPFGSYRRGEKSHVH